MGYYEATGLTPTQRDEKIVELRRRGFTYRQIAPRVGMSPGGVLRALRRIGAGRGGGGRA
jgi:DNA-binding Lrp family transcriptional regulator